MAEAAAAPVPVAVAPAPAVKAAGRGRGKAKAKGRGKFKGKAKAMKVAPPALDENGQPIVKPKKEKPLPLRQQVEQEVGDRNIEDVIKEARAKVEELQAAVAKAQEGELGYEKVISEGKMKMEEASAAVDSAVAKETIALEKFKAAKQALVDSKKKTIEKKLALGEEEKAMDVLASEGEKNKKEADLLKAKEDALKAKEEAKKALHEAQARAKQIAEDIKNKKAALAITDDPEAAEKAKVEAEKAAAEAAQRKEAKALQSNAAKDLKQQLRELEKARHDRDKERARAFKTAAGLGGAGKKRALGDVAASPAKAANIQDVD